MRQAVQPWGEARNDFAIFSGLAAALGVGERFTEGHDEMDWLRHLYDGWRDRVPLHQLHLLLVHAALFGGAYRGAVMSAVASLR